MPPRNSVLDPHAAPLWPSLGSHRFIKVSPQVGSGASLFVEKAEEPTELTSAALLKLPAKATTRKYLPKGGLAGSCSSPSMLSEATTLLPSVCADGRHARLYALRMEQTKDANSSTKNRSLRAAYNSKMPNQLVHEEAASRLGAVNRLGKMRLDAGPHADLVVARLEDDDPRVRRRAVWALKEMSAPQLEPHKRSIGDKLKHKSPEVRVAAAELLAFMGKLALDIHGTNALLLEQCLKDDSVAVRQAATDAFFKWGTVTPAACAGALAAALGDSDPLVRKLACLSLGGLGAAAQKYQAQVAALLLDSDAMVRRVAQPSLTQLRGK